MTTRSRTGLFRSYRDSQARSTRQQPYRRPNYNDTDFNSDEHDHLISDTNHVAVHIPSLPPLWVDFSDQVEDILADTQIKIRTLDKLHAKHVLPGFSDRSQEERDIEALTTDITKAFRSCQSLIQKIANVPHQFPPDPQKSSNGTSPGKNVQRGLAAKVQDLSAIFRKKQRVYMESTFSLIILHLSPFLPDLKYYFRIIWQSISSRVPHLTLRPLYNLLTIIELELQGHATKNQDLLLASGTISLKGSDGLNAVDDDIMAASHTRAQSQSLIQTDSSHELQARDRELTEIAKSIASLAELFKDLSVLVIDQGTLLDSVEFNVEQTAVHMEDSVKELTIATRYQKNTGKRKCIFLLLLVIFGLIVVLIFKPKGHRTAHQPPTPAPTDAGAGVLTNTSLPRTPRYYI